MTPTPERPAMAYNTKSAADFHRQSMNADIVCVGFGPAMGGFLTTMADAITNKNSMPAIESRAMPGMPLQIICYERADDISFGVSGVATKARGIKASFPNLDPMQIPMATPIGQEKLIYLFDPIGASLRQMSLKVGERSLKALRRLLPGPQPPAKEAAVEIPYIPPFLRKEGGLVLSMGQFMQWVGDQIMATGAAQIWPSSPVAGPLIEDGAVVGVRLIDQGTDKLGNPNAGFMPGMDVRAPLTVVGDGPMGAVGQALDCHFGLPSGNYQREWAVGMKMVVDLPINCTLAPGTVLHTLGYPEPEIFGFLYTYPDNIASFGIFMPSWLVSPVRTTYRYLQHWMLHPYLWKHLQGSRLRSWGAKSLNESGRRSEPFLVGDGYARIGEGSGSTNVLTGSGMDEAWTTGADLARAVIDLARMSLPFTKKNLEATYVHRRRESFVESGVRIAERSRDGFQKGVVQGLLGMTISSVTNGRYSWPKTHKRSQKCIPSLQKYFKGRIPQTEIERIYNECTAKGQSLHNAFMDCLGWPNIPYDEQLLISHQDALLLGGKVQAPPGYADHIRFLNETICHHCKEKICIEACSGQAITTNPEGGIPFFDREKCVHCGACLWNCSKSGSDPNQTTISFQVGAGGLHSAEN
ncbi:Electron transfer flavoprotein-ubiquinone oxidoreductase [Desulfovibrionales bacterium]